MKEKYSLPLEENSIPIQFPKSGWQTIKEFLEGRSFPTKRSIRWYIHANVYGFNDYCCKRLGKKVLISPSRFEEWVEKNAK